MPGLPDLSPQSDWTPLQQSLLHAACAVLFLLFAGQQIDLASLGSGCFVCPASGHVSRLPGPRNARTCLVCVLPASSPTLNDTMRARQTVSLLVGNRRLLPLGLLAKPQIVTLPFVLLLWDYWPLQRNGCGSAHKACCGSHTTLRSPISFGRSGPSSFSPHADSVVTVIAQHAGRPCGRSRKVQCRRDCRTSSSPT